MLGNIPVLLEKIQGDDAGDIFAAGTNSELTLLLEIKATSSVLVHAQVVGGGLKEAIHAHVHRIYILDDQLRWVGNCSLRSSDAQTEAHAVLIFHEFNSVTLAERTITELFSYRLLMVLFNLVEIELSVCSVEISIVLLKELVVFNGAFIEPLLDASLANRFISNVV